MSQDDRSLAVPALTGKFGQWRYYQLVLRVRDLVQNFGTESKPDYRVKAVEEVEEIYSRKGVSELLQRAYDPTRLAPIKNYILNQTDRYVNNLTVGIFGGAPDWFGVDIEAQAKSAVDVGKGAFKGRVGIVTLNGTETLFVLDGQHRLKGLRKAFAEKPSKVEHEEVVCTLIVHEATDKGRIRTRRLFSTINRHAKPVSKGENILLDEDDVSAIVVRALIEEFEPFVGQSAIALSKSGNITSKGPNQEKLTTVVTLYDINERLINHASIYPEVEGKLVRVRPENEKVIDEQKDVVFKYWEAFLKLWPSIKVFLKDSSEQRKKYRKDGGSFVLRPIAQAALFEVLKSCGLDDRATLKRLQSMPESLTDPFWHYVLWDPHKGTMLHNKGYARNYIKHNVGLVLTKAETKRLQENYRKGSGDAKLNLPKPRFT